MTVDQTALFAILLAALALFIWGKWRYDVVAIGALLAAVFAGIVPAENAFAGLGHPAVITVAAIVAAHAEVRRRQRRCFTAQGRSRR